MKVIIGWLASILIYFYLPLTSLVFAQSASYVIQPLSTPSLLLTIGGNKTWTGNPEGTMPIVSYTNKGSKLPVKAFVGIHFLGQYTGNAGSTPLVFEKSRGDISLSKDLAFISFIFNAGKINGVKYNPDDYSIKVAIFEAIESSYLSTYSYGKQLSNPIVLNLQFP